MTALPQDVVAELKDRIAELEQRLQAGAADNGRLARELASSRERQKASAEILATIAGTTGEAEQALQQIAETTARLFGASSVSIQLAENGEWGKAYRYGASAQRIRAAVPLADLKVGGRNLPGAVVGRNQQIDVPDLDHPAPDVADFPGLPHARAAGTRTMCGTPLRSKGTAIGSLIVHRDRLEPFSDEELALLQSFADQAAIAIENARLFNETRDALERQTATADVLQIISRSAFDLSSVLQTLIEVAAKLCRADQAQIYRRQGEVYRSAATCGNMREAYRAIEQRGVISPGPDTLVGRVALEARPVQIADAWNDPHYGPKDDARLGNLHSMLGVPLLRDGELVGAFALARDHVEPFADREIELVRTFADQAVIAIENTRLFNETKDALARQTATADILRVISRSPTDVQPVFDAIVQTVVRLVGCETAFIQRCDGKYFWSVARCTREEGLMTVINPRHAPIDPSANFPSRAIVGRTTLHLSDWSRIELPEFERRIQEQLGYQSAVYLPLLRDGECIGVLGLAGSRPGMFGETEIALAEAFRDQALIAIENTRLFKETQEALERQTATSEILKVIASSPSDVQPVFDAIATSSKRLIGGFSTAVFRFVDGIAHLAAFTPTSPGADELLKAGFPSPVERFEPFALAQGGKPIQVADIATLPDTGIKEIARARGFRSMLFAPLMSSGVPIGLISVTRIEAGSFIDHHVQLLQTFADQAVIAIENAHLFEQVEAKTRELTESLQQQTATADVLKAISRSAFDL
ncbi:GAF domain-containing protein, partial [Bradyrhizobium sp.]|uniref:GAF domain-containing protein n=1 Tax=Bradyrhizobium sp. TaxID=376 RepID=UPI002385BB5C